MVTELGSRIYYEKSTGNVIFTRGDMAGFVQESSIDEDFDMYNELQQYNKSSVGVIELPYGELSKQLEKNKSNTYKVDISVDPHKLIYSWLDYETGQPGEPPKTTEEQIKEESDKVRLEYAMAIAELTEKVEKDKLELSTAIVEIMEMNSGCK